MPRRLEKTAPKSLMAALIARAWSAPDARGDERVRAWSATAGGNAAAHRRGVPGSDEQTTLRRALRRIRISGYRWHATSFFCSGNRISHVAEIAGVRSDAHFCGAFRKRFGALPTTVGRSFQGKQRSEYYPVETLGWRMRVPFRFRLGSGAGGRDFSAIAVCGRVLLGRRGSKRSGARMHAARHRVGCRLKARYCGGGPCQPAGLRP